MNTTTDMQKKKMWIAFSHKYQLFKITTINILFEQIGQKMNVTSEV